MELMSSATAFATIIGLLCNFKSEHSSSELSDFIDWLKKTHHVDVINSIEQNQLLLQEIKEIISNDHEEMKKMFNEQRAETNLELDDNQFEFESTGEICASLKNPF